MPSEPDNAMDRLLKAYAARRRDEAGAPLELHPATRRMLQSEAARGHAGPAKAVPAEGRWLGLWLPRLAGAAVFCAILSVTAWVLFRPEPLHTESNLAQLPRKSPPAREVTNAEARPAQNTPLTAPLPSLAATKPEVAADNFDSRSAERKLPEKDFARLEPAGTRLSIAQDEAEALARSQPPADGAARGGQGTSDANIATGFGAARRARPDGAEALLAGRFVGSEAPAQRPATSAPAAPSPTAAQGIAATSERVLGLQNEGIAAGTAAPAGAGGAGMSRATTVILTAAPAAAPPVAPSLAMTPAPTGAPGRGQSGRAAAPEARARYAVALNGADVSTQTQAFYFRQVLAGAVGASAPSAKSATGNVLASFSWQQSGKQLRVVDADGSVYAGEWQGTVGTPNAVALKFESQAGDSLKKTAEQTRALGSFRVVGTNRTLRQRVVLQGQLIRQTTPQLGLALEPGSAGTRPAPKAPAMKDAAAALAAGLTRSNSPTLNPSAGAVLRMDGQMVLGSGRAVPVQAVGW